MNTFNFKTVLTAILLTSTSYALGAEPRQAGCNPQFLDTPTEFPTAARDVGAHGVVLVDVQLNADGRVARASLQRSSGNQSLDRSAVNSVRKQWRFDVANCSTAELAVERTVEVHYRRSKPTLSGTVNRKHAMETKDLLARNRCNVSPATGDTTIYACVENSAEDRTAASAQVTPAAQQP